MLLKILSLYYDKLRSEAHLYNSFIIIIIIIWSGEGAQDAKVGLLCSILPLC